MHYPAIKASEYEIEDASLWKLRCAGEITKMTQTHMHFANRCPAAFLILPSLILLCYSVNVNVIRFLLSLQS